MKAMQLNTQNPKKSKSDISLNEYTPTVMDQHKYDIRLDHTVHVFSFTSRKYTSGPKDSRGVFFCTHFVGEKQLSLHSKLYITELFWS